MSRPFNSYTAFSTACLERYIYAIERHPSLEGYRDFIPRVRVFIRAINSPPYVEQLNQVKYILAHKDPHFANAMVDPSDPRCPVTSVLDWEFYGVVPAPRWNPPRVFLWNVETTPEPKEEQTRMENVFKETCRRRGVGHLLEEVKLTGLQQAMQGVVNYLRAIVEVCPRGQARDKVRGWREAGETAMKVFKA